MRVHIIVLETGLLETGLPETGSSEAGLPEGGEGRFLGLALSLRLRALPVGRAGLRRMVVKARAPAIASR